MKKVILGMIVFLLFILIFMIVKGKNDLLSSNNTTSTTSSIYQTDIDNTLTENGEETTNKFIENTTTITIATKPIKTTTTINTTINKNTNTINNQTTITTKNKIIKETSTTTTTAKTTTTKQTTTATKKISIWESLGISEDDYNNKPAFSGDRVDFKSYEECFKYGYSYEPYINGEETFNCSEVISLSGKFLGIMFKTEKNIKNRS